MIAASRPATFDAASQRRRQLIAKIHVAKKQLGLTDDDYRAVLIRVGGRESSAQMSDAQLADVVQEFARKGFTAKARVGKPRPADHPVARKARAMWISLHQLGAVDNASEAALEAFACRQLQVAKLQWADQALGYKLIEALKAMADRAGWPQDLAGVTPAMKVVVLKRRLVEALLGKLWDGGLAPPTWDVNRAAYEFGGVETNLMFASVEQLDVVARAFATKLRVARGEVE
jgi:phage gp16-like protein